MVTAARPTPPARLPWTGDAEADSLIAGNPTALLIGFCLDQQITVQKAFSGPRVIRERLGTLDAGELARMDTATLVDAFRRPPAIHRFPQNMARRVQSLCAELAEHYDGDTERIWTEAADAADLERRLARLPGIGGMKVRSLLALLAKQYGVRPAGIEERLPEYPTLADVTTPEELEAYQAGKRAYKAQLRAQGIDPSARLRGRGSAAGSRAAGPASRSRGTGA